MSAPFLAQLGSTRAAFAQLPALELRLRDLVASARTAFPTIDVDPAEFVAYVAQRMPAQGSPEQALETLHAGDLYLACACAQGDPRALAVFETQFLSQISSYLARRDALPAFTDEVRQMLRERVLVGREGLGPKIASYSGRGPLGGWLRMTATRIAIDLRRSEKPHAALEAGQMRLPTTDPELALMKTRYGREFRRAFEATLAALPAREASVLRLHYLEGMTAEAIGSTYRVHARTIQKWIAKSRQHILAGTRRLLGERLGLNAAELDSLMALVQSQLDVSIVRFLDRAKL